MEVQQTFYKIPRLETAIKWRQEAPPGFEFALKAWQLITHPSTSPTYRKARVEIPQGKENCYGLFNLSDEVLQAWEETSRFAQALRARVIVFQCPPSFRESSQNVDNMRRLFQSIENTGFLFAWEQRGDWNEEVIKTLCHQLGLIHCVDPGVRMPLYGKPRYFRLHGAPRYRHHYSEEELEHLKAMIQGEETYVLFNNINMYHDALAFDHLIKGQTG